MGIVVATDQMGSCAPKACFGKRITEGLDIGRVIGKTKVIITAERQQRFAVSNERGPLRTGYMPTRPIQTGLFPLFEFKGKIPHDSTWRLTQRSGQRAGELAASQDQILRQTPA
jgi:hypothetical protein